MHETVGRGEGSRRALRGGGGEDTSKVDEIEDRGRCSDSSTHTPTRCRGRSESSPETTVRSAATGSCSPSGSVFRGGTREFEETSSQMTNVPRASSLRTSRIWSRGCPTNTWNSGTHWSLATSIFELSKLLSEGASLMQRCQESCGVVTASGSGEHGHHVNRGARYGYRGVRLGEAMNPGPPNSTARHRSRSRNGIRATVTDSSSDDEIPLAQLTHPADCWTCWNLTSLVTILMRRECQNAVPRIDGVSPVLTLPPVSSRG